MENASRRVRYLWQEQRVSGRAPVSSAMSDIDSRTVIGPNNHSGHASHTTDQMPHRLDDHQIKCNACNRVSSSFSFVNCILLLIWCYRISMGFAFSAGIVHHLQRVTTWSVYELLSILFCVDPESIVLVLRTKIVSIA